jgi:endonuclease/exonuclease/phosphatase family metal-dependent hydrolase
MGVGKASVIVAGLVALGLGIGGVTLLAGAGRSHAPAGNQQPARTPRTVAEPIDTPARATQAQEAIQLIEGVRRFGVAEAPDRRPGTIRLAAYNVENLFDDHDDPALSDDVEDIEMTKPEAHRKAVAEAIRAIDADIVALQEIESEAALLWFRDQFLSDLGYAYVKSYDAGDGRGIENSVLSRFPITNASVRLDMDLGGVHPATYGDRGAANWLAGEPLKMRRSPLFVDIQIPAGTTLGGEADAPEKLSEPYDLTLIVVHHKSGGGSGYWREAEATKVASIIREFENDKPGRNIAVLGDFNSTPQDKVYTIYGEAGLKDVHAARPTSGAAKASAITHASGRVIDMILVNGNLWSEVVEESVFVYGTPILPEGVDYRNVLPPTGYASDHFPVVVDLVPREDRGGEPVKTP